MTPRVKSVMAGVASLAVTGLVVVGGAGIASAAPASPFDPGSNGATQGSISFYDASGNLMTSGPGATPPAYAVANTWNGVAGSTKASLFSATPVKGQNVYTWPSQQISSASTFPITSGAPANIMNKPNATVSTISTWFDATNGYQTVNPNANSDPAWQGFYQLRMLTSGAGIPANSQVYASATIYLESNGSWTQVFPTQANTSTTLSVAPASPKTDGPGNVTLTAAVKTPNASGTALGAGVGKVQFRVGGSDVGAPQSLGAGGQATLSTAVPCGVSSISAVFTPNDAGSYAGSTSNTVSYQVKGTGCSVPATTTTLSVNPNSGPEFQNVTLSSTVTGGPGAGDGVVKFYDNGAVIAQANVGAGGVASTTYNQFAAGAHPVTATFVPADATNFQGSTSATVTATYDSNQPPTCTADANGQGNSSCRDPQAFKVTVPAGSLAISTPYTPANPFDLGTAQFNATNGSLLASKAFPSNGDKLTITDLRPGELGWTAYVQTTDFATNPANSTSINGNGLAFAGLTYAPNGSNALGTAAKPITVGDVNAFKASPAAFANAPVGGSVGSVNVQGTMTLTAPSSTVAGTYFGTVTFTVS